jgi:hypothetical protein
MEKLLKALQAYARTHGSLPPPAICSKEGKPLLSWRVALLPYLGHHDLYQRFRLDQPWDSPYNKLLLAQIPTIYSMNDVSELRSFNMASMMQRLQENQSTETLLQLVTGPGTAMDRREVPLQQLFLETEDWRYRILLVEVHGRPVPWTQPLDWECTPQTPLTDLVNTQQKEVQFGLAGGDLIKGRREALKEDAFFRSLLARRDTPVAYNRLNAEASELWKEIRGLYRNHRAGSSEKLLKIKMAMQEYHVFNNRLPEAATVDKNGQALLSWRVTLLPYLGHYELYQRFHHDEPWDSPHNRALLPYMPDVYDAGMARYSTVRQFWETTPYKVLVGPGTLFERNNTRRLTRMNANNPRQATILVVEGGVRIPWTKPEDIEWPADAAKLGGVFADGFHALLLGDDENTTFLRKDILKQLPLLEELAKYDKTAKPNYEFYARQ